MLDRNEIAAYMTLLGVLGPDEDAMELAVEVINALKPLDDRRRGDGGDDGIDAILKLVKLVKTKAGRDALALLEEERAAHLAKPAPPLPAPTHDLVLSAREQNIIDTWQGGRGKPMPEVVAIEIKRQFRDEKKQTQWVCSHWKISSTTAAKLRAEVEEERARELEAGGAKVINKDRVGEPKHVPHLNGAGAQMPAWATQNGPR